MLSRQKNEKQSSEIEDEPVAAKESTEDFREKWLRALADSDNLRKRVAREKQAVARRERQAILERFLEPHDSLRLALETHEGESNEWIEGTKRILDQMTKILKDFGVETIVALDQPFDPNLHEAVGHAPPRPGTPEGLVVHVVQSGFRFADDVLLRPARVLVGAEE